MSPGIIILSTVPGLDLEPAALAARALAAHVFIMDDPRGYGHALAGALSEAVHAGCTHAIVFDAGRAHDTAHLPAFIEAIRAAPGAIIVGMRDYPGEQPSLLERLGCWNCDFWTWAETGRWIHDTIYGFKAYPLQLVGDLAVRSRQIDCEVEMVAKAIWAGANVVQIPLPIHARAKAISSLAPGEIVRFAVATACLTFQRVLLPLPLRAAMHRKDFACLPLLQRLRIICRRAIIHNCDTPSRFAICIGLGVFFGIAPIWGFQMLAAAATAHALGLSKRLVLAAAQISSPVTVPLILYASLVVGQLLFHGRYAGIPRPDQIGRAVLIHYLGEYLAGSVTLALGAALIVILIAYLAAGMLRGIRPDAR